MNNGLMNNNNNNNNPDHTKAKLAFLHQLRDAGITDLNNIDVNQLAKILNDETQLGFPVNPVKDRPFSEKMNLFIEAINRMVLAGLFDIEGNELGKIDKYNITIETSNYDRFSPVFLNADYSCSTVMINDPETKAKLTIESLGVGVHDWHFYGNDFDIKKKTYPINPLDVLPAKSAIESIIKDINKRFLKKFPGGSHYSYCLEENIYPIPNEEIERIGSIPLGILEREELKRTLARMIELVDPKRKVLEAEYLVDEMVERKYLIRDDLRNIEITWLVLIEAAKYFGVYDSNEYCNNTCERIYSGEVKILSRSLDFNKDKASKMNSWKFNGNLVKKESRNGIKVIRDHWNGDLTENLIMPFEGFCLEIKHTHRHSGNLWGLIGFYKKNERPSTLTEPQIASKYERELLRKCIENYKED